MAIFVIDRNPELFWFTAKARVLHKKNRSARQLPPDWRIEKSVLCKYVFCYSQFGWLKTKFIEITDLLSYNFSMWRLMFDKTNDTSVKYWRVCRQIIWSALWIGAEKTGQRQLKI